MCKNAVGTSRPLISDTWASSSCDEFHSGCVCWFWDRSHSCPRQPGDSGFCRQVLSTWEGCEEDRNKVLDSFVPLAEGMMGTPTAPGCAAGCNLPVSGSLSTWMLRNGGSGEGGQGGHVLRVLWPVTNCIIACACHGWVWVLLWCLKRYCQEKEKKLKKQLVLFRQCENRF